MYSTYPVAALRPAIASDYAASDRYDRNEGCLAPNGARGRGCVPVSTVSYCLGSSLLGPTTSLLDSRREEPSEPASVEI